MKKHLTACLVAAVSIGTSHAGLLFDENFDNTPPYTIGTINAIPEGLNQISHGGWYVQTSGASGVYTTSDRSLSPAQSVGLFRNAVDGGFAQLSGALGINNTAITSTTSALRFTFAFQLYDTDIGLSTAVSMRDVNSADIGRVYIGNSGKVTAQFSSMAVDLGPIDANTWYLVRMDLPTIGGSTYTASLFASDGTTLIGSQSGSVITTMTSDNPYNYFTAYSASPTANVLWLDNVSVETVPEPSTAALCAAGALTVVLLRRRRKLVQFAGRGNRS